MDFQFIETLLELPEFRGLWKDLDPAQMMAKSLIFFLPTGNAAHLCVIQLSRLGSGHVHVSCHTDRDCIVVVGLLVAILPGKSQ
jgi:hypothetical protein